MNLKILLRSILALWMLVLVGCKSETATTTDKAAETEGDPPSIIATNFAIGCFVDEIVEEGSIQVFNPVAIGEDPAAWKPSAVQIHEMKYTRPLIFIIGEEPEWISELPETIKVVSLLPGETSEFSPGTNPTQALEAFNKIETAITETFPDLQTKVTAPVFQRKLSRQEEKWAAALKGKQLPSGMEAGIIRPSSNFDFIALLDKNFLLLDGGQKPSRESAFEDTIIPILERSCLDCHDEASQEGDLNFELYLKEDLASLHPKVWESVAQVVELGQMPPRKKTKLTLTEDEKSELYSWTKTLNEKWESGAMGSDPGRTTIHRLNKNEYNYTIRDLFGLKLRPADNFPEDGSGEEGFDNNADTLFLPALLVENYFEAASTLVTAIYDDPAARRRYLLARPGSKLSPDEAAEEVLRFWTTFIYRKPSDDKEVARLVSLFRKELDQDKSFDVAMQMPLYAMLISPNFLYRSSMKEPEQKPYLVDDFELASRLSYFLWSSMPDRELFKLASEGKLQDPKVIEEQVERMLLDEKSKALGMHFGGQWFGWEELRSSANPDAEKYPQFTFKLRVLLYQESMMFFNDLLENDGKIYSLLDSDYTFLNDHLAKFYKIPGVEGSELRRVKLSDSNRGGVLGMGSVLTATSVSLRSSPSIRGSFVVKEILGISLPEPPMDIEQLPEDDREIHGKTFRDTLARHREDPNCSSCHGLIDPIGFGLESFDAIGQFRTEQNGFPLDTTGTMPDGSDFGGASELKSALLTQKEKFAKTMVSKILTYAVGRDLTPYDRPVIKEITDKVIAADGSIHTAFVEVAKSFPFRYSRDDSFNPKPKSTTAVKSDIKTTSSSDTESSSMKAEPDTETETEAVDKPADEEIPLTKAERRRIRKAAERAQKSTEE